jgi:spore maturation protein CgeB
VLLVDNCFPYHPEFLRKLRLYKVLRTTDGPLVAYDRDFAYVHAYDHVLYHSPAYSRDLDMAEKLRYVGARRADFLPLPLFDRMFDPARDEQTLMSQERDVDIVFVGALFPNKMPLLARVKKAFGKRVRLHGLTSWKRNAYFNAKYGFPGWVRPIAFEEYVPLYQRSRIGINVHNRGMYTVGSFRLLELPANGVMQISDGGPYLSSWFDVGREVVGYDEADDLVAKITYYLDHEEERAQIAAAGYRAVMQRHRLRTRMQEATALIRTGIAERKSTTQRVF